MNIFPTYLKENLANYQNSIKLLGEKKYNEVYQNLDSLMHDDYFLEEILTDENFKTLHNRNDWKTFKTGLENRLNQYDNTIRMLLKKIQYSDQGIRLILLYHQKNQPQDTALTVLLNRQMKKIDLESAESVKKIIDDHGWLGKHQIGKEANETLFLAIQHIDDSVVQTKYLPILSEAVKNKAAEPWQYAFLTDRILMNQGKKQRYGTQTIISDKEYGGYVVPLENPDQVDKLRQEMGLESLKEYLNEFDIEWDLEKYKRDAVIIEKRFKDRFESLRKNK
ncbi:hypothetical protein GCM10022218_25100 [Sphingobacterium ginsenosidimutans]|uniref:Uncharacterized protein n=2 Tax=Sphingobacterium ginsenosidimutans TaxID=687845 RepID=A0ABP8A3J0_9SPHI